MAFGWRGRWLRRGNAEPAVEEIDDQGVALCREAAERIVAAIRNSHQLGAGQLGDELCARHRVDLIVVAMDNQQGQLILRYIASLTSKAGGIALRLNGLDQYLAGGLACPFDAVLDLFGRVRIREDVADEVFGEVGIVGEPVLAIALVPTLEPLAFGYEGFGAI